jgi:predicted amidohydrolase YtcJ
MTSKGMKGLIETNKYALFALFLLIVLASCSKKKHADIIVKGGVIYTVDSAMSTAEVMVIDAGKIVEIGNSNLLENYHADTIIDATGKFIYPGLIDAHSHFYGLGAQAQKVDLTGTNSWQEVLEKCKTFAANNQLKLLIGRGWDQNDWMVKEYPDNSLLNELFPSIPVLLKRVDGHAAIANNKALQLAGINLNTQVSGGELLKKNKVLTGVLIDNAVDLVEDKLPKRDKESIIRSLLLAQEVCFQYGLTGACDAGLPSEIIYIIDSLQQVGLLHMRIYAMISANDNQVDEWLARKPIINDRLNVSSFKMYADGALGSRGACLMHPYADQPGHHGLILTSHQKMEEYVKRISQSPYQLNTHCIGDSANRFILQLYGKYLNGDKKRRWRIEHAQVVNSNDFDLFGHYGIIPSVQPTHATSDMYWAKNRLGEERLKGAYALKTLMKQNGWIPLGTDFPVESPNPFHTFYSAVARMDAKQFPAGGFQIENALSREEALRGMTIWAAKAAIEEHLKGSLEKGKLADFIMIDKDLLKDNLEDIRILMPTAVFLNGKRVK